MLPHDADQAARGSAQGDAGSWHLAAPGLPACRVDPKTVRRERPPDYPENRKEIQKIAGKRRRFNEQPPASHSSPCHRGLLHPR